MKRCSSRCAAAALAVLLLAACSSAPKRPDAVYERRDEAARLTALAAAALRGGQASEAAAFYAEAYRLALSVDDAETRVAALDGLAGVYLKGGSALPAVASPGSTADWSAPPADLAGCAALAASVAADSGRADLAAFASLSGVEASLRAGSEADIRRAAETAAAAEKELSRRPAERSRALRLLGEARKASGDAAGALAAFAAAAELDARDKRFAEYAASRYLAASVHSKNGAFPAAREALLDALAADRKAEHPAGIGADYRALGQVAEKSGDRAAAAKLYAAARDVYAAARLSAEAADAERRRAALE